METAGLRDISRRAERAQRIVLDLALAFVAVLMVTTPHTVLLFHTVFLLLTVGAFFLPFAQFATRGVFWVSLTTIEILETVREGATQTEELIEIPMLSLILVLVFAIANHRKRARREMQRSTAFLEAVVHHTADAVIACDAAGRLVFANDAARLLGGLDRLAPAGASAHPPALFGTDGCRLEPDDFPLARAFRGERIRSEELRVNGVEDGDLVLVVTGGPLVGTRGEPLGAMVVAHDISARKLVENQLAHLAHHDPLTNLANRALFYRRLTAALDGLRDHAKPFAVMVIDLDDFKTVNDELGHGAGDELLVAVAGRLRGCVEPDDTVSRLGGDEFAVLLDVAGDDLRPSRTAELIIDRLRSPFMLRAGQVSVQASVGVVALPSGRAEGSPDEVLHDADIAMYMAKGRGKGCYEMFDPTTLHSALLDGLQRRSILGNLGPR